MPAYDAHVFDITRVIQLAIAPVFMLTAVASILNALLGRLARAVDRRRVVEGMLDGADGVQKDDGVVELLLLARRIQLVLWAIGFAVLSALLICLLIGTAFLGAYTSLDLSHTATAGSDAGIDVVSSEYATVAAEQSALENLAQILADQIMARLATYGARTQPAR